MRAIAAFALTAAIAGAAGAYPLIAPERTALERAAIAQASRARNREHWITVDVDERGFVNHIVTDDPNLVPSKGVISSESGQPPRLEIRSRFEILATPTVTPEQVSARLVGTTVTELAGYGRGRTMFTTRSVKLRTDDVHTRSFVHADGDRVRLVYWSEPHVDALPPDPSWGLTAKSCDELANIRE